MLYRTPQSISRRFPVGPFGLGVMWLMGVFTLAWQASATAQYPAGGNGLGGLILADRNRTRVLREAQELVAAQKYLEAVNYLQTLIEEEQDTLLRPAANDETGVFRSMKAEVRRIIECLPPEGREVYLRNVSPAANVLLKEAIEQNDADKLARVARLYYHTPAGYEAVYRMGLQEFDHGKPMAAALILRRLQRTPEAAKQYEPMLSLRIALSWIRGDARGSFRRPQIFANGEERQNAAGRRRPPRVVRRDWPTLGLVVADDSRSNRPSIRRQNQLADGGRFAQPQCNFALA